MEKDQQKMLYEARRLRLANFVQLLGGQAEFVREVTRRLSVRPNLGDSLKSFQDASYLSRVLRGAQQKGGKNIGEAPARALEDLFDKPHGWMSNRIPTNGAWPFEFSKALWDELDADEKKDAERHFQIYLTGLRSARSRRKKTG